MLKVLIWNVTNEMIFKDKALKILEQQHNGVEIVGSSTSEDIGKVDCGAYDVFLVVGAKKIGMSEITKEAVKLHLP